MAPQKREAKYVEAWPRVNLVAAFAAVRQHRPLCLFRRGHGVIGQCILPERRIDQVLMAWIIADRDIGFAKERAWLPIEPVPNRLDPTRHHFVCPGCSRRVATLVFKSGWACRLCHGMAYRRQLIPKSVIAAEAAQAIGDQIGRGRPAGMHHKTFARLVAERDEQRPLAGGIPPEASLLHERVISPEWVAFDDFELWFDDYMARSGKLETVIWPD